MAGQGVGGGELARTTAVLRFTAQQLRRAGARLHASAVAARSTAAWLRALGDAVLAQADAISQRAVGLPADSTEMSPPADERPPA